MLRELYLSFFILADNLEVTKSLRAVSKTAYNASYDYFKLLIRTPILINYIDSDMYIMLKTDNYIVDILKQREQYSKGCTHTCYSYCNMNISFETTVKGLFQERFNQIYDA